jgi:hypothetical protein
MGVNAQIEVPAFTAGQVLTAAEMTQVNTGIPVFATTVTRDAAFGGAGEKVLAEGQFAYIEASNATQYYDGAAWQTISSSALVPITTATATGTATLAINNCFSATYNNYLIVSNIYDSGAAVNILYAKLTVGGVAASTNYQWQVSYMTTSAGPARDTQTAQTVGLYFGYCGNDQYGNQSVITLSNPFVAGATVGNLSSVGYRTTTNFQTAQGACVHTTATSYDGLLINSANNITGTIRIYGIVNS